MAERMNEKDLLDLMSKAQSNAFSWAGPSEFNLKGGGMQVDIQGKVIETGYEFFETGIEVRMGPENGQSKLLFERDATCVGPYNFRSFTRGSADTLQQAAQQIMAATGGVFEKADSPLPKVKEDLAPRYESPDRYQTQKDNMQRVVWKDAGMDGDKHRVTFALACDEMKKGDPPVPNPYLKNARLKDGSVRHDMFLPGDLYDRLQKVSGPGDGPWKGAINTYLVDASPGPKGMKYPALDRSALENGYLTPATGFSAEKHDQFVKASLAQQRQSRRMPDVPGEEATKERQLGE